MSAIQFRTLGTLDLRAADGRELHSLLAQPKRVALLAYLCIAQPRGYHRRDTLLGLFWPDSDQEHARTSLRKSLHILRRALGENAILSRGDEEVAVDFQQVSCDVASFENLISSNRFADALELYSGDLLTGFFVDDAPEFEQWLHAERTRLKASAARAAYAAAGNLEKKGDPTGALGFARRSLELSDTDERALRKLIELQVRAGDRAAAIETYETFARSLAMEYQTQPSMETRLLVEQIQSGTEPHVDQVGQSASSSVRNYESASAPPFTTAARTQTDERHDRHRERIPLAAAAIAVFISGGFIWALMRPAPPKQVLQYTLNVDSAEAMVPGDGWWSRLALSPDGTRLAYVGGPRGELLVRPRSQLRGTAIPGTKRAQTPFFSPDGRRIGFLTEQHVYIASLDGAAPVTVCDSLTGVAGASWGPDGFIYVDGQYYAPLLRVEAKAGAAPAWFTHLDTITSEIDHTWPDVLPNGKGVLFGVTFAGTGGVKDSLSYAIAVAEIPSGKHRVIVNDARYARYAASGYLLYITTSKKLMVAPFDQNSMRVTGDPTVLADSMRVGRFGSADLAVSATGTLVFATGGGQGRRELVWVTRDGKTQPVDPDWLGDFGGPALSPDGKRLAISRRLNTPRVDIMVKDLDRGPSVKLTLQETGGSFPAWTPDGKSVSYTDDSWDSVSFWRIRADGSGPPGPPVFQFRQGRRVVSEVWSPDGKWLLYASSTRRPESGDIGGFRPGIDKSPVQVVATKFREGTPAFSPDGRWLAYTSNESGQNEIYVVPFPNFRGGKWAISSHGGTDPEWSHRGNELFYRDSAENLVTVEVRTTPTISIGRVTPLFSTAGFQFSDNGAKNYAVSPDDRRFLMIRRAREGTEQIIVVENWFDELRATRGKGFGK